MTHTRRSALVLAGATLLGATLPARADDQLKLTIGQRGNWDTSISHLGDKAGIFKKYGLELEMIYTAGSGETLQPVISGSVDIGLAVGTPGAMAAFAKGAPVRIIGAEATGAADYWFVKATSPIKTLKDLNGHTIAYSTSGSSTESIVRAFIKENNLTTAKPMSTGNGPSTMTAVMTGQVDAGWASPPFGLKQMADGQTRLLARATDAAIVRGQTIRVVVANTQALEKRKDVIARYMQALSRHDRLHVQRQSASAQRLRRIRRRVGGYGQARAQRVLPEDAGDARRDQGPRIRDGGGGRAEIHSRAAEQGSACADGANPEANSEAVAFGASATKLLIVVPALASTP